MKMKHWILLAVVAATGCSTATVEKGDFKGHSTRWFWDTREFSAQFTDTNGSSMSIKLSKSGSQTKELGEAVAAGIIAYQGRQQP